MNEFPKLKSNRLILRKITYRDIPKIVEYAGNKTIAENTLNIPHPYTEKDAVYWINNVHQGFKEKSQYAFGISLASTLEFIGAIGLKVMTRFNMAELGYWIAEPFWNKGYATEAAAALLKFGFNELELNKIYAIYLVDNPASGNVMIKNGMIKEAELKDHTKKGDLYKSLIQYRLTRAEFESQKQ